MSSAANSLQRLLTDQPICFVDVGARGGLPLKWRTLRGQLRTIGFEPDLEEYERLSGQARPNELYINSALYSSNTDVTLYCTRDPNCSSIYPPNQPLLEQLGRAHGLLEVERTISISATTLDDALAAHSVIDVDFIKIDTQGSELDVLRGAERTIKTTPFGVELEVEFAPLYSGQPLFPDVHRFLSERGFTFMGFPHMSNTSNGRKDYRSAGDFVRSWLDNVSSSSGALRGAKQLVYADAVFLRSPAPWLATLRELTLEEVQARVCKAVAICCVTNYYEYASLLLKHTSEEGLIDSSLAAQLKAFIRAESWRLSKLAADVGRVASRLRRRLTHLGE